jgi:hypothetical protein
MENRRQFNLKSLQTNHKHITLQLVIKYSLGRCCELLRTNLPSKVPATWNNLKIPVIQGKKLVKTLAINTQLNAINYNKGKIIF